MVTFGGAYAVLAYVAQQAVEHYGWLKPGEMLDGLGMAETTPGPLIMVAAVRRLHGRVPRPRRPDPDAGRHARRPPGDLGHLHALLPWIFLGAPYIEGLRGNKALAGALSAITAAVVGVILNLAVWFGIHTLFRQVRPLRSLACRSTCRCSRASTRGPSLFRRGRHRHLPVQGWA